MMTVNQSNGVDVNAAEAASISVDVNVAEAASISVDVNVAEAAGKPSISRAPGTVVGDVTFVAGGLGTVKGLRCAGVSAGFRRSPQRLDLALVVADSPVVAAGVFTKNIFCAAPVMLSRQHLAEQCTAGSGIRAIVLNSGNANASTGTPGMDVARRSCAIAAEQLGCRPNQVLVASTGVIGVPLSEDPFTTGIAAALSKLGAADGTALDAGLAAARAIMTTDTHPKQAAVQVATRKLVTADGGATQGDKQAATSGNAAQGGQQIATDSNAAYDDQSGYRIGGMVKGSGMIQPDMATLLGVLATDAPLTHQAAGTALRRAIDLTLNKVTVDSDTSTNDSVFLLATGASALPAIDVDSPGFEQFVTALTLLCEDLARQIAYDGEGATKLVTVNITGAQDDAQADLAGRSVANSPLVKTAIAGHDANWGRIAMAIGKSGASFRQEDVDIAIMGIPVLKQGLPLPFSEDEALRRFQDYSEIVLDIDLGAGPGQARLWSCDMTHDYISINADYRS